MSKQRSVWISRRGQADAEAAINALVRGYERPQRRESSRAETIDRRGATTNVQEITNDSTELLTPPIRDKSHAYRGAATSKPEAPDAQSTRTRSIS